MNKLPLLILVFFACILILTAFGEETGSGNPLPGTRKQVDGDGTLVFTNSSVTVNGVTYCKDDTTLHYELVEEDMLRVENEEQTVEFTYVPEGDRLTLDRDGENATYVRVRDSETPTADGQTAPATTDPDVPTTEDSDSDSSVPDGNDVEDPTAPDESGSPSDGTAIPDGEIKSFITGTWQTEYKGSRLVYQFNEDGTGMVSIIPMTYTVENGVITVTATTFAQTEVGSAAYSVSDHTLALEKNGETDIPQ